MSILFVLSVIGPEGITFLHDRDLRYTSTAYEAACGQHIFRLSYRNSSSSLRTKGARSNKGRVESVTMNGKPLGNATEDLNTHLSGRFISKVEIMNCGLYAENPMFQGAARATETESRLYGLSPSVHFKLQQENGAWRIIFEK